MNRQPHSALPNSTTPYEVMFSRKPRWKKRVPRHMAEIDKEKLGQEEAEFEYSSENENEFSLFLNNEDILYTPSSSTLSKINNTDMTALEQ